MKKKIKKIAAYGPTLHACLQHTQYHLSIHQTKLPVHEKKERTCQNCNVNPLTADPDYICFFNFLLAQ